jgi:hypothetical protein
MKQISMMGVEDWLPERMKDLKRAALAGDTESEFAVGLLIGNLARETNNNSYADIGARFLARAAKKGHTKALSIFSNTGMDWRKYDY